MPQKNSVYINYVQRMPIFSVSEVLLSYSYIIMVVNVVKILMFTIDKKCTNNFFFVYMYT